MQSRPYLLSKILVEAEAQAEDDKEEVSGSLQHEEEVDKEAADYSADSAKPQGALFMSTPPITSQTAIGGPRKMLRIFVL